MDKNDIYNDKNKEKDEIACVEVEDATYMAIQNTLVLNKTLEDNILAICEPQRDISTVCEKIEKEEEKNSEQNIEMTISEAKFEDIDEPKDQQIDKGEIDWANKE